MSIKPSVIVGAFKGAGKFARGISRAMDKLACTRLVGRGPTSSAVVNQASREAVVLILRAFILTPARSACLSLPCQVVIASRVSRRLLFTSPLPHT